MTDYRNNFLDEIYDILDFKSGDLININSRKSSMSSEDFIDKGHWLETCRLLNDKTDDFNIEKIFFVQRNPVVVFVDASNKEKGQIFNVFNSVWSLARPRLVFVEQLNSVVIYDLASIPAKSDEELTPLAEIIKESKEILRGLKNFNRSRIESGVVFEDKKFERANSRADQTLINDLIYTRKCLFEKGLSGENLRYAHALIGRSIFIRYLEDRGVLTKDYFTDLAEGNPDELKTINTPLNFSFYRAEMSSLYYPRVLSDKNLTFKLFSKIAEDFNGDTFSTNKKEEEIILQSHLTLLQNFLLGSGNSNQGRLFLWAYRFDIIPIDLISSIYEEFYHSENLIDEKTSKLKDSKGTHYTPSSLVEFVLTRSLTSNVLEGKPKILDPACGSGIFLVESFRRIVRFEQYKLNNTTLGLKELLSILKNQISGIEINPEAIKIAAFSLYLSLLNFLDPPDILNHLNKNGKLPFLIERGKNSKEHYNILLESNTFNSKKVDSKFHSNSFDVIVGNPPWGSPSTKDLEGRRELKVVTDWCNNSNLEFPDKELSHAFIWRAIDFLKPNGICALLVSSGVLLKYSTRSNTFKQQLLNKVTCEEIVNFSHVRRVFFSGAISPFLLMKLRKSKPRSNLSITYISLRRSKSVENNKIALIDYGDIKFIKQFNTNVNDIWKIHYWGNSYDFKLISAIRRFDTLCKISNLQKSAQGFKEANKSKPADWLRDYKEIPVSFFNKSNLSFDFSNEEDKNKLKDIPLFVEARGKPELYDGKRILIRRGVIQKNVVPKGQIIARLETEKFAFRHSIICIHLDNNHINYYEVVIGILWSSLFRYYMFMTASTWGTWRQEIHLNEVLEFPIAIFDSKLVKSISAIVIEIQKKSQSFNFFENSEIVIQPLKEKLDNLVFQLYELTEFEINLITDRCHYSIDYYYQGEKGVSSNRIIDLNKITPYLEVFKKYWSKKIKHMESFGHSVLTSEDNSMLGVVFSLKTENVESDNERSNLDISEFAELLNEELSRNVYSEGVFKRVTKDDRIIIIKRNLEIHWTKSEAIFDAEAAFIEILNNRN